MSRIIHIDESLKKIKPLLLICGIEVEKKKYDRKHKFIFKFNVFWLFGDVLGSVLLFIEQITKGNEFVHILYTSPIMVLCSLSVFKSISFFFDRDTAQKIYSALKDSELEANETSLEKESIISKEKAILHNVIKVLNMVFIALSVAFALHPFYSNIVSYIKTGKIVLVLPFQIKYPFDAYNIKYWPAVYLHQIWSEIFVIWGLVVVDHLLYIQCSYIRIHLRLLRRDFEHLINDNELSREQFNKKFRELVIRHIKLIRAADLLEALNTKSILCNFISSSLMICLTGFGLVMIKDINMTIIFVSFLSASLLQVFFLCFFGDSLMLSSMEVGDAVYNSEWYSKDSATCKNLLVVLVRSQWACKLTAYRFTDVNLNAFMKVVGNAWSYFALLQSIYG